MGALTLRQATERLKEGMQNLPEPVRALEGPIAAVRFDEFAEAQPQWFLVLDHEELEGQSQRPQLRLSASGIETGVMPLPAAAVPLSQILEPIELDGLTVVDDRQYLAQLIQQKNLPDFIKDGAARAVLARKG